MNPYRSAFMMLTTLFVITALGSPADAAAAAAPHRWDLEVEAGPVWQTINDVQIPNDETGTRFSLVDVVGKGPWPAGRVYLSWNLSEKRSLRALYAPLSITETGELAGPVSFAGEEFAAGPVDATYKFNSYRLSYRQRFHEGAKWSWWWGLTVKVRDAQIALAQGGDRAVKDDLGFVPLAHLAGEWRPAAKWRVIFDADALAGGPGRAEDVALKISRDLGERTRLAVGYRMVEGGADVDEVYAFAWLHYAVVSLQLAF
jgi:hypothetical protein